MSEEINFDDVEFGEPIEEREPNYRDGYIRGIYRARNIIDSKQKEIERLNNIIEEYKNANEYHQNIIHELETMKQPNQLHSENVKLRAENNRLNNIINELEKTLLEWHEYWEDDDSYSWQYKNAYDYLQELKGSDKE